MQVPATFADGEWNTTQTIRDLKRYMIGDSLHYPSRRRKKLCARLVWLRATCTHVYGLWIQRWATASMNSGALKCTDFLNSRFGVVSLLRISLSRSEIGKKEKTNQQLIRGFMYMCVLWL